ncbi:MAG: DUF1569 domain-containing protein [Phycisphaerales bacterium]
MAAPFQIDTKKVADRRPLSFNSIEEIEKDMDHLLDAERDGRLRQLGNWTPGQIFWHVGEIMRGSFEGIPLKAPWFIRVLGATVIRKRVLGPKGFPTGIPLRGPAETIIADPDITSDDGAAYLRTQLHRVRAGEKMTQRSPFLGPMSHEDWCALHRNHAALHFSFLRPE